GDQVDLFVTPESGYQLVAGSLKVNGDASIVEPNGINQYKFSMPAEDVEVTAHFELIPTTTYAISIATDIENGTVVANPTKAAEGAPVTLTVTPDANYQLVAGSLKYNGNDVTETAGTYTFIMPGEDVLITAQFELIPVNPTTYAISIATDIENGTVVANPTKAAEGTPVTLTVIPDANYQLVAGSLKYNGNDVTEAAGTYTFIMPGEDVLITAQFELSTIVVPSVESIALNSTAVTLEVTETHLLQATVLPAEANQSVSWSSNNEAVATVVDGEITAVAMGTAIITATTDDGGHTAHCVVNVNNNTLPDAIASFEDLTLAKADTFWTGASNPDGLFTSFVSGTYRFVNTSGWGGTYWAGFAYTNTTATDAASWNTTNVGTGIDGSQNYGVAYYSSWDFPTGITVERTNTTDAKPVSGMYVTNTAQVIDVLNNGNAFARKFEQGDWFKLTATADNGNSLDFYLADFRSSDATEHYIVDSWEWLDLSPLGDVKTVSFTMSSSDVGAYGVNTPTYFAFDDFGGVAPTFTLTYSAGPNGTVEGQQSVTQFVSYGKDGDEVIATPVSGYQFLRWSDGLSWGNGTRRDYNVKENINVTVEFVPVGTQLHYISYFASPGGSIKGQTSQRVADGQSSIEVKAVANNGYRFDKWNDGNEQAARFESDVHQDDFYTAYFIKQIRVDYMAAANGRIEGKTTQIVDRGVATEAVTAIANAGYRFVRWSDGVTEATRTDIIDLDIDDTTFVAQFELIRHILTISVLGDDAQPIAGAKVTLGGKDYITDAKGVVVDTLLPKTYAYTVELSGYNTQTGEVNLVSDTLVKVILSKPSAPATGLFDNVIESLSVYPNPTVGAVQVEANGMVMVYNAAGQLLQRVPAQGKVLIDLSSYPAGFYFVVVGKAKATIVKQ
ncbi:MAG: DUF4465 domain-containing protein, partial [Bacteroidales bacterium]|nr:DUF4465 domain-containing protein [Bacteroidales bacterium]